MIPRVVLPDESPRDEVANGLAILQAAEQAGELKGASLPIVEAWHAVAARLRAALAKLDAIARPEHPQAVHTCATGCGAPVAHGGMICDKCEGYDV